MSLRDTVVLYDREGKPHEFPASEVPVRLREGFGFPANERVGVLVMGDNGEYEPATLPPDQAHRVLMDPNSGIIPNTPGAIDRIRDIQQRRNVESNLGGPGAAASTFAIGFGDELTFGGTSAAVEALGGSGTDTQLQQLRGEHPTADIAGRIGGTLASAAVGLAPVRGAGAAARALAGGGAASVMAGERAGEYAARALLRAGADPRLANAARVVARGGVEGYVGAVTHNLTQSNIDNTPLDAEQILSEGGLLSAAIGIGAEGVVPTFGAAVRLARRARAAVRTSDTPAGRLLSEGRVAAQEAREQSAMTFEEALDAASESSLRGTTDPLARAFNRVATATGGQIDPDILDYVATRNVHDLAALFKQTTNELPSVAAQRLTRADDIVEAGLQAVAGERRFARYTAEFEAMDTAAVRKEAQGVVRVLTERIQGALDEVGALKYGDARGLHKALSRLRTSAARLGTPEPPPGPASGTIGGGGATLDIPLRSGRPANDNISDTAPLLKSAREIYEDLDGLRQGLDTAIGTAEGAEAPLLHQTMEDLRGYLRSEQSWGRVGREEKIRAQMLADYLDARLQLLRRVGAAGPGRLSKTKEFSADRIRTLYTQLQDVRGEGIHRDLENFVSASHKALTALEGIEEIPAHLRQRLERELLEFQKELTRGTDIVASKQLLRDAYRQENDASGFAAALSLGSLGGVAGYVIGGPIAGLVAGASSALVAGALTKPTGFWGRVHGARKAWERYGSRLTQRLRDFRNKIVTGARKGVLTGQRSVPLITLKLREYRSDPETYRETRARVESMVQNPQLLVDTLTQATAGVRQIDPELEAFVHMTAVRGVQYLAANMPPEVRDPMFPNQTALLPSRTAMDAFIRRVTAIEDPLSVLDDLIEGRVSHESAEAVRVVYPEIHADIAAGLIEVMTEAAAEGHAIPHQTRLQLGTLFRMESTLALNGAFIAKTQQRYAQTPMQQQQIFGPLNRPARAVKSQFSSSTLTDTQRLLGE